MIIFQVASVCYLQVKVDGGAPQALGVVSGIVSRLVGKVPRALVGTTIVGI